MTDHIYKPTPHYPNYVPILPRLRGTSYGQGPKSVQQHISDQNWIDKSASNPVRHVTIDEDEPLDQFQLMEDQFQRNPAVGAFLMDGSKIPATSAFVGIQSIDTPQTMSFPYNGALVHGITNMSILDNPPTQHNTPSSLYAHYSEVLYDESLPNTEMPFNSALPITEMPFDSAFPITEMPFNSALPITEMPFDSALPITEMPFNSTLPITEMPFSSTLPITTPISATSSPLASLAQILEKIAEGGDGSNKESDPQEASDMPMMMPFNGEKCEEKQQSELVFHQGMAIDEVAERLALIITREQLHQLTLLIQRKVEPKNQEEEANNGEVNNDENEEHRQHQQSALHPKIGTSAESDGAKDFQSRNQQIVPKMDKIIIRVRRMNVAKIMASEMKMQLARYRARVRERLNRKLEVVTERVRCRMEQCHLNIRSEERGMGRESRFRGWQMPDWAEECRKVSAEGRGGRSSEGMTEEAVKCRKQKRGRSKMEDEDGGSKSDVKRGRTTIPS